MATSNNALGRAIPGLQKDYRNQILWEGLKIAPVVKGGANGYIQVRKSDARPDARDPSPVVAYNTQHRMQLMEYARLAYSLNLYDCAGVSFSQREIDALEGENPDLDLVNDAVFHIMDNGYAAWLSAFSTAAATLTSAGTLNLSVPNGDVKEFFLEAIDDVFASTGARPTHVYVGAQAASKLMLQDDLQNGTAIAGDTGTNARRTGGIAMPAVYEYFRNHLGLELVVEGHSQILTSGVPGFSLTTTGFLGYAKPNTAMSTIKTIVANPSDEVVRIAIRENSFPYSVGVGVTGDAEFQVLVTSADTGRKFGVTLA